MALLQYTILILGVLCVVVTSKENPPTNNIGSDYVLDKFYPEVKKVVTSIKLSKDEYMVFPFLLSTILRRTQHLNKDISEKWKLAADLIGGFAVALNNGQTIEEIITDSCYKDGTLQFSELTMKTLAEKEQDLAKKEKLPTLVQLTENMHTTLLFHLRLLQQLFFRLERYEGSLVTFKSDTLTPKETKRDIQYMALALDQAIMIIENGVTPETEMEILCTSIKANLPATVPYDGLELLRKIMERQEASAAYLLAPIHAAVLGYLLLSS